MIKGLAEVSCPAGQHFSEAFGGCVSDTVPLPPVKTTWIPGVENWMVIGGVAALVLVMLMSKK